MDITTIGILNEVDELFGKLDKLPPNVKEEVLKQLSQKVHVSQGSRGKKARGRPRGRGNGRGVTSSTKYALQEPSFLKKEPEVQFTEISTTEEAGTLDQQVAVKQEKHEEEANFDSAEISSDQPEGNVLHGRRQTKKLNYKLLSEYGHSEDDEEGKSNIDFTVKVQPVGKRGRGRPRKNTDAISVNVSSLYAKEEGSLPTSEQVSNVKIEQEVTRIDTGSVDLLESCLKESGIKAVGEKVSVQDKPDVIERLRPNGSEQHKLEADGESDPKSKKVYVCDTLESINSVCKKRSAPLRYKCQDCGKLYSSLSVLKTHRVRHRRKEDLPFSCKDCDFRSASKIELSRHSLKHESSVVFTCKICNKNFSRDTGLREHMEFVHAKSRTLKCGICNFATHRRSTMRNHLRSHQGTNPVIACPVCGVTFKAKSNLRTHLFSHAGLKRFSCDECDKKFISLNRVKAHKIHVHGPREHKCPFCEMKFPTRHALNRHVLVHTGEKPFQCCFCAFNCNTQGNLIKHIRQVHEKINFTYKDFLRESSKEQSEQHMDDTNLEEMQKKGNDFAHKLFNTIGESLGENLTVEQLKEEAQKKRESKVAAFQEQLSKRKKRVLKKALVSNPVRDKKIAVFSVAEKSGDASAENAVDENVYIESGLHGLGDDSPCWLTQTDENGCVMLIPWDVSLISENDEGEEEAEWNENLPTEKIMKVTSTCDDVAVTVSKNDDLGISNSEDHCNSGNVECALEIGRDIKDHRNKSQMEMRDSIIQVSGLGDVVDEMDPLDVDITIETSNSINVAAARKAGKQIQKTVQVINAGDYVNSTSQNVTNFVLPEGYIVDDEGQVLQLTDTVMDENLLQLQMGQNVSSSEAQEVTLNKIPDGMYSFISRSDAEKGETFVISTSDKNMAISGKAFLKAKHKACRRGVNLLSLEREEEDSDQQSALVLIVDAEDIDS